MTELLYSIYLKSVLWHGCFEYDALPDSLHGTVAWSASDDNSLYSVLIMHHLNKHREGRRTDSVGEYDGIFSCKKLGFFRYTVFISCDNKSVGICFEGEGVEKSIFEIVTLLHSIVSSFQAGWVGYISWS